MKKPGLDLGDMVQETRKLVMAASANKQVPYSTDSLTQRFCFAGCGVSQARVDNAAGGINASPNTHRHGSRSHSHPLPATGLNHQHGNGALATANNPQESAVVSQNRFQRQPGVSGKQLFELAQKESNLSKAMDLYKQAAVQGHVVAFKYVDELYALQHSRFTKPRSEDLFSDPLALFPHNYIGNPELFGSSTHEIMYSEDEAIQWYKQAAQLGYARANTLLALIYSSGNQSARQSSDAILKLFEKASSGGSGVGSAMMAMVYYKGLYGVRKDIEKTKQFIVKAKNDAEVDKSVEEPESTNILNWWFLDKIMTEGDLLGFEELATSVLNQ